MTTQLFEADWVFPVDSPPIRGGAVAVAAGRVLALGAIADMRARHPGAHRIDLTGHTLLPGLVNAHTHLELSDCTPGQPPPDGFTGWLVQMLTRTRIPNDQLAGRSEHGVRQGIAQCLRYGVTTVGDISRQCHITRPILRKSPLRVISYGEVMAMAQRRSLLQSRLDSAADRACQSDRLRIGLTPHAPYSIEPDGYRACLQRAIADSLPLATHLAESNVEAEFLASHSGPLRDLWDAWLTWDAHVPRYAGGPIRYARDLGLLDYPTLLAHVNYADDDELAILAAGRASVVYCPRTHAFFAHPPHRFRDMLARGINVAIGTDSCASSADLNLLDDLRLVHRLHPDFPMQILFAMATLNGAKALGLAHEVGSLTPGKAADILAFPTSVPDPLRAILGSAIAVSHVYVAGQSVAHSPRVEALNIDRGFGGYAE